MNVILIGPKNIGKTTLAIKFAKSLNFSFIDTDQLVLADTCYNNVVELTNDLGMLKFRQMEKLVISDLNCKNTVIATGGGVVLDADNRQKLSTLGMIIYVNASLACIKSQIDSLPIDCNNLEEYLARRVPHYQNLAHIIMQQPRANYGN